MTHPTAAPQLKVLVFAASLRAESHNRKLAALGRGSPPRRGLPSISPR